MARRSRRSRRSTTCTPTNQVAEWRRQLIERAAGAFGGAVTPEAAPVDLKALHAKIGQLTLESDFLVRPEQARNPHEC